jgi:hypothetical protein
LEGAEDLARGVENWLIIASEKKDFAQREVVANRSLNVGFHTP